uniref:Uncharacterized protein n=1 Tax=Arundo donax TaxID=35708 RepID=A0A0A9DZ30_ARUDO
MTAKLTCWTVSQDPCMLSVDLGCVMVFRMKVSQALEMVNQFFQDLCLLQW